MPSLLRLLFGKDQRLSFHFGSIFLLTGILFSGNVLRADSASPELLFGGSFERPPIHRFLLGSKRTLLYPATLSEGGHYEALPLRHGVGEKSWGIFLKGWRERASLRLATLDPEIVRDSRGVIQMAVIATDDPCTSSCVLIPGFLKRFSALFGPELILAIPARNKVYVFPKLANSLPAMVQAIRDDYLISPMPVSTELFELSKKGLRAIGNIDPEAR